MAFTKTQSPHVICLSGVTGDWTWTDTFSDVSTNGVHVDSIELVPGDIGTSDILCVKHANASGATMFHAVAASPWKQGQLIKYFHGLRFLPFLDFSSCSFSVSGASAQVVITYY